MKKLKKGIPFLIYMMIWSLYILFAWSRTHPGQIIYFIFSIACIRFYYISALWSIRSSCYLLTYIILWYDGAAWLLS